MGDAADDALEMSEERERENFLIRMEIKKACKKPTACELKIDPDDPFLAHCELCQQSWDLAG